MDLFQSLISTISLLPQLSESSLSSSEFDTYIEEHISDDVDLDISRNNIELVDLIRTESTKLTILITYFDFTIDDPFPYYNKLYEEEYHTIIPIFKEIYDKIISILDTDESDLIANIRNQINTHPSKEYIYYELLRTSISENNPDFIIRFAPDEIYKSITAYLDNKLLHNIIYSNQHIQTIFIGLYQFKYISDLEYALLNTTTLNFCILIDRYPARFLELSNDIDFQIKLFRQTIFCGTYDKLEYIFNSVKTELLVKNLEEICDGVIEIGFTSGMTNVLVSVIRAGYNFV
jgi:hypothetical protein